jgi:hypothetical protein
VKYHVELKFEKDELMKFTSRRIIYDGKAITDAFFTPRANPTGAQAHVFAPNTSGDGLARRGWGEFQWDVTNLAKNAWNPERLVQNLGANRIEIKEAPDGDLVGAYSAGNADRVRVHFECPRKFGYNLAKMRAFNVGEDQPAQESNLTWKQGPNGLWYVATSVETLVTRDEKGRIDDRMRAVLMYSNFEPNAKVDPKQFTIESLGMPAMSPIVDNRPGAKERVRRLP